MYQLRDPLAAPIQARDQFFDRRTTLTNPFSRNLLVCVLQAERLQTVLRKYGVLPRPALRVHVSKKDQAARCCSTR